MTVKFTSAIKGKCIVPCTSESRVGGRQGIQADKKLGEGGRLYSSREGRVLYLYCILAFFFNNFTLFNCPKQMVFYLLWKITIIWFLFEKNQTRGREVIEQITKLFTSYYLHERGLQRIFILTLLQASPCLNRYYSQKRNVVPLHLLSMCTNFLVILRC